MTVPDLAGTLLACHGAVLLGALTAFYKYGDRSESFRSAMQATDDLLTTMRRRVSAELAEHLYPVFDDPQTVPSPILGRDGNSYVERPVNPVRSERYRQAVSDFIEGSARALVDYRSLCAARESWSGCRRSLSWAVLVLAMWQAGSACMSLLTALGGLLWPDDVLLWTLIPTMLLIGFCFCCLVLTLRDHDKITSIRERYNDL